jgi:pimeloyl-ACP methyl ester carboxylesterase
VDHGLEPDGQGGVRLKCRPEDESTYYRMAAGSGAYTRLRQVGCPVTLLHGGPNGHFTPEVFAAQCAQLPIGRVEPHLDLGHFAPMEDPDAVADAVRRAWEWTRSTRA